MEKAADIAQNTTQGRFDPRERVMTPSADLAVADEGYSNPNRDSKVKIRADIHDPQEVERSRNFKTIQEAANLDEDINSYTSITRRILYLLSAASATFCTFTDAVLPKDSSLAKFFQKMTKLSSSIAFGAGAATGAVDAMQQNDPLLAAVRIGDGITAAVSDVNTMTMNRGLWIGAENFLMSLKLLFSKKTYRNSYDSFRHYKKAIDRLVNEFKTKNPIRAFFDSKNGVAGAVLGLGTSFGTLLNAVTGGNSAIAKFFRYGSGTLVEAAEKLKLDHLDAGRPLFWGSGAFMTGSSIFGFLGNRLDIALNALGRIALFDSTQRGELSRRGRQISLAEMPSLLLDEFTNFELKTERDFSELYGEKEKSVTAEDLDTRGLDPEQEAAIPLLKTDSRKNRNIRPPVIKVASKPVSKSRPRVGNLDSNLGPVSIINLGTTRLGGIPQTSKPRVSKQRTSQAKISIPASSRISNTSEPSIPQTTTSKPINPVPKTVAIPQTTKPRQKTSIPKTTKE